MLETLWFHTKTEDNVIEYQGEIISHEPDLGANTYLVQLYSFLDGRPTCMRLLDVDSTWDFYHTNIDMNKAYEAATGTKTTTRKGVYTTRYQRDLLKRNLHREVDSIR